tara:strand:+ start:676 stop:1011 length:336 start_codon:yes stop_codon:yes gene_type:complete
MRQLVILLNIFTIFLLLLNLFFINRWVKLRPDNYKEEEHTATDTFITLVDQHQPTISFARARTLPPQSKAGDIGDFVESSLPGNNILNTSMLNRDTLMLYKHDGNRIKAPE